MNTPPTSQSAWQRTTTRRVLCWLFSWRIIRRCLLTVASVVTLVVLFYAEENWRGRRAWDQHRHALEAQGEKFDIAALAPPPVPDEQNLALAPMLKAIYPYIHDPDAKRDTNGMARLQSVDEHKRAPGNEAELVLGSLEQDTFADLEACAKFYLGNTNYPQPAAGATAAQTVLTALSKFDADFSELTAAAAARPLGRFPIHYTEDMPSAMLLPHLATVKHLGAVLNIRATARLELGQSEAALGDLTLAFRLADSIRGEPILISHLVRIAMLATDLQTLREGLIRHTWTEAQLGTLEKQLAAIDLLAEHNHAMRGERAFSVSVVDWARRQGWKVNPSNLESGELDHQPSWVQLELLRFMPGGWYHRNMVTISQLHQDSTLAVVNEHTRRVSPQTAAAGERAFQSLPGGPGSAFVRTLFSSSPTKAAVWSARMQTWLDAVRIACTLERYRLANGQLPDSLAALAPRFLKTLPADLIDGQPLRYRKESAGGFILYSVGWNQKDDGGTIAWTDDKKQSVDPNEGDWVCRVPR
jgi:hypothetical protein